MGLANIQFLLWIIIIIVGLIFAILLILISVFCIGQFFYSKKLNFVNNNLLKENEVLKNENKYSSKLLSIDKLDKIEPHNLLETITTVRKRNLISNLSPRELETAQLLAKGLTYPEIADALFISVETVRIHAKRVYAKTNCTKNDKKSEFILKAIKYNWFRNYENLES